MAEQMTIPSLSTDWNVINKQIDDACPVDEFRPGQREAIVRIIEHFINGKKYVALEAPTGAGKSIIGMTVAKVIGSAWFITIQKTLQDQLARDFSDVGLVTLKGRGNYYCNYYERLQDKLGKSGMSKGTLLKIIDSRPSCDSGECKKSGQSSMPECMLETDGGMLRTLPYDHRYSACEYFEQFGRAMRAKFTSLNFTNFLLLNRNGKIHTRDLTVIDEAHNAEPQIMGYVSLSMTDEDLRPRGIKMPIIKEPLDFVRWILDNDIPSVLEGLRIRAVESQDPKTIDKYVHLTSRVGYAIYSITGQSMKKLAENGYDNIEETNEWVVKFEGGRAYNQLIMQPIWVKREAERLLFSKSQHVLMMSATMLDPKMVSHNLGIDDDDFAYVRMNSTFHPITRPIYVLSASKNTGGPAAMKEWMPKIVDVTDQILDARPGVKGIIHTHNYAITHMLMAESKHSKRFISQINYEGYGSRDKAIKDHADSKDGILVAPAMHEGLDLHGDLSRLQIVCKMPYPSFFDDPQLKRRKEIDERYYMWLTGLKYVQSIGRSIRSNSDYAETFVIDYSYEMLHGMLRRNGMLPTWVEDATLMRWSMDGDHKVGKCIKMPRSISSMIADLSNSVKTLDEIEMEQRNY